MPLTDAKQASLLMAVEHLKNILAYLRWNQNWVAPENIISDAELAIYRLKKVALFPEPSIKSEPECQPTNNNSHPSSSQELPSSGVPSSFSEAQ